MTENGNSDIQDLLEELDGKKKAKEQPKEEKKKIPTASIVSGTIDIDKLKFNEKNRPIDNEKVKEIMESIESVGLLIPIIISKDNEVLDGERRVRACQALGLKEVPFIRRKEGFDETCVIANYIRENLTPDQVAWILKEQEGTQEEIAKKFGLSQGRVSQLIGKRIAIKRKNRVGHKPEDWKKPRSVKKYLLPENVCIYVQKHCVEILFKLNEEMLKNPLKNIGTIFNEIKDFNEMVSKVRNGVKK